MTKIDFYTGSDDKLRTACQLSHKAMQNGVKVLLHVEDESTADKLDKLLWHYPPTAFLPHCRDDATDSSEFPVVVGHRDTFPHFELLISLHTRCVNFFSRFERVIEIVSTDAEDAKSGRERYAFYRDRGYDMRHFNLAKRS